MALFVELAFEVEAGIIYQSSLICQQQYVQNMDEHGNTCLCNIMLR